MSGPEHFRIAICGGGISGLCLAVALAQHPHISIDLYEAAGRFSEIGAGVMMWSRTWKILERMGLAEDFAKVTHPVPHSDVGVGFDYRRSDQPEEGFQFHLVEWPYGCITFHRAHFLDVLVGKLPPDITHFGKRLVSYEDAPDGTSAVGLSFSDGTSATCDVLLGCDGIKSVVRRQMYEERAKDDARLLDFVDPIWSGTVAYRGLIDVERLRKSNRALTRPMMYCGKSKHVVAYSISQGRTVNVITFSSEPDKEGTPYDSPWVAECPKQELLDCYAGWEPDVHELVSNIDQPTKWALHLLKPLPFYVCGRVALVGDAAHAMLPHQGAGAGQAIEDAFSLASVLSDPSMTLNDLPAALRKWEQIRLP